jgi:recombinational DNA repair protein RecT
MMNLIQSTIDSIQDMFSLNEYEMQSINKFLSTELNNKFQFGHDFFTLKDVQPTTMVDAITPYVNAGLQIDASIMELEARYHEAKFCFEFEISHTFTGLTALLMENTSIQSIVVNPVYENDELKINHATQEVIHNVSTEPSQLHGLYCIIDLDNGQSFLTQMSAEEANQALYANTHDRLNGVNPYITNSKKLMFYKTSCLRRGLKTISAMKNCDDFEIISKLLNIHDRQFNKAKALRKVMPLNNFKFRGCSKQPSEIDQLFKVQQGSVVIPFSQAVKKDASAADKSKLTIELAGESFEAWPSDSMGVGF